MDIIENASLIQYNTFRINAQAKFLIKIENSKDLALLPQLQQIKENSVFVLGGGSNILFTKNYNGVLLYSSIKDIEVINETKTSVIIKCGSGIIWDELVSYCVNKNWGGIENLSNIPGSVGAAPVQNIGAYGVEAKDSIIQVEGIDFISGKEFCYNNTDCNFAYRDSIFKTQTEKFISYVYFKLSKKPKLVTHYGNIEDELESLGERSIKTVRKIIIAIRDSKLPSIKELASGGSFFKNPIIDTGKVKKLLNLFPEMPNYKLDEDKYKLSAAWLIDNAKLKGIRKGKVGTYNKQPLVIVNYGEASGKDIVDFSSFIQKKVFDMFDIMLESEVIFK